MNNDSEPGENFLNGYIGGRTVLCLERMCWNLLALDERYKICDGLGAN